MSTENSQTGLERAFTQLGDHDQYDWVPLPEEHFEGVYNKVLYFNRVTGEVFELVKIEGSVVSLDVTATTALLP
ncbi:hypothetical protein GCM10009037_29710 [Halarchaeum grantii]|uniref:Uncharacterized protein n=1 Tax=Halarchaeum grantii TaxID=1193105 RepID=A0A830FDK3_9EURY|nr:hypothetical protein [Halarchaeum grantii]GGL44386.1 hypothetical protein GCM10009037_29710 [Halarchaeum grantii]